MLAGAVRQVEGGPLDDSAWERVLPQVAARLQGAVRGHVRNLEPMDVLQESALAAFQRTGEFRGSSEPEMVAWILAIAVRKLRNHYRYWRRQRRDMRRTVALNNRQEPMRLEVRPVSARLEQRERQRLLSDLLARLPKSERQALVARYVNDSSIPDIAASIGRTEAAVGGLLKRGLARLRRIASSERVDL